MDWLKLYVEIAFDPKVRSMPENFRWRLVVLMCLHRNGMMPGLTEKQLAIAMGVSVRELAKTKLAFIENHFVDTTWVLVNWEKRQRGMSDSRERTREWRDRHRDGNVTSHDSHSDVTRDASRARERREEERREEKTPPTPPGENGVRVSVPISDPGPEFTQLGELAIELSGDLSLGRWVTNMARLEHTAPAIRYALEQGAAAGKWSSGWLQAILKRVAVEGVPAPPPGHAAAANGVAPSQWIDAAVAAKNAKIAAQMLENEKKREARNAGR